MTESRIKRLWKNRLSKQISGFHFNTCCISPNILQEEDNKPPPPNISHNTNNNTKKKLWRKPLPNDCPIFDFNTTGNPKDSITIIVQEKLVPPPTYSLLLLEEKTEIPTRHESRYYEKIPNLEAQLDRACKNEKAVLLTKLLSKQQRH